MTKEMLTEYEMTGLTITEQFEELSIAVKYVDKLHGAIRRKMYAEGFEEGRKAGREEVEKTDRGTVVNIDGKKVGEAVRRVLEKIKPGELTAQERRDRIVEQAKADIEDLKERMISITQNSEGSCVFRLRTTVVYFVVNKEKRTIVAIIKDADSSKIYAKGIAKCGPSDCFNAHIGKAIALRRALGLEVPVEYINTPQPTEVRVGDVVDCPRDPRIKPYKVDLIEDVYLNDPEIYDVDGTWLHESEVKVIDDSREEDE